jgi:hypothetical protein
MQKGIFIVFFFWLCSPIQQSFAETQTVPDTVLTGIYITSIHDIDFKQKEYTVNLWLWLKYKNREFDFSQNLEVPQAKTVTKSFFTADTSGEKVTMMMKLQCVMKDSWKIGGFPFDHQKLRMSIENSQYDARTLIFVVDTVGKHYGKYAINGWKVDSLRILVDRKAYETAFGDTTLDQPRSEYSAFRVALEIKRDGEWELFIKIFLGMYIALLIAFICFYIPATHLDSRFGLSVGALFAVIGNKYIIDSSLPETTSFTLVDTLHGLTLLFILIVIAVTTYTIAVSKNKGITYAKRFNNVTAVVAMTIYILLNIYFVFMANHPSG